MKIIPSLKANRHENAWTFINNNNLAIPTFQVIKYVERLWLCISSSSIKVPYIEAQRNCYWLHFYHSKDIKFTRKRRGQKPSKDLHFSLCRQGLKNAPRTSKNFPNKCDSCLWTLHPYTCRTGMRVKVLFFIHAKDLVMHLDQSDYSSLSKLLIELKHILDVKLRALENIYVMTVLARINFPHFSILLSCSTHTI